MSARRAPRARAVTLALALSLPSGALSPSASGCGASHRSDLAIAARAGDLEAARARYEALRADDGDDDELLGYVAEALLVQAANGEDEAARRAAIDQLALAGTRTRDTLEALALGTGPSSLDALEALARVGDRNARRILRGFADSDDARARASAVLGMQAEADRALLERFCVEPAALLRERACPLLAALAPDQDALALLAERARVDPSVDVRLAITRALASFEALATPALRDRLSDAEPRVRSAALESLLRADRDAGREAALALLETSPSASTLDAARLLATRLGRTSLPSEDDRATARLHLVAGLQLADAGQRSQAALALVSSEAILGDEEAFDALGLLLESEPDVGVRLTLARALLDRRPERATAALERVLTEDHGMVGVQAAAVLAARGASSGVERLREELRATDPSVRRVAARALARDAMRPSEVREAFDDEDPLVRVHAAGGVLAALAYRRR